MYKSIIKPQLFAYAITPQTIAAGVTVNPNINISNDADFELLEIRASIHKAAAFTGNCLMQLSLTSGDLFSNVGIDLLALASVQQDSFSGYPIRLSEPVKIPANSVINCQITNNSGEELTSVQVQLWGYKRDRTSIDQ